MPSLLSWLWLHKRKRKESWLRLEPKQPCYLEHEVHKQRPAILPKRLQWCHSREYRFTQCRVNHWMSGVWVGRLEGWLTAWMNGPLDSGWMDGWIMDGCIYGLIHGWIWRLMQTVRYVRTLFAHFCVRLCPIRLVHLSKVSTIQPTWEWLLVHCVLFGTPEIILNVATINKLCITWLFRLFRLLLKLLLRRVCSF